MQFPVIAGATALLLLALFASRKPSAPRQPFEPLCRIAPPLEGVGWGGGVTKDRVGGIGTFGQLSRCVRRRDGSRGAFQRCRGHSSKKTAGPKDILYIPDQSRFQLTRKLPLSLSGALTHGICFLNEPFHQKRGERERRSGIRVDYAAANPRKKKRVKNSDLGNTNVACSPSPDSRPIINSINVDPPSQVVERCLGIRGVNEI